MVVVVCFVCRDNDVGTGFDEVLLWQSETGVCGVDDSDDGECDIDDATGCAILLWSDFADFGDCEFAHIADFAVGDGTSVFGWGISWCAGRWFCGRMVCDEDVGIPYCGSGVVWGNETVFSGDEAISMVGVFIIFSDCGGFRIGMDLEKTEKSGKIKRSCIIILMGENYVWT